MTFPDLDHTKETLVDAGDIGRTVRTHRTRRECVAAQPVLNSAYRTENAVIGIPVFAVGVLAIPYPGPGWLIVFVGLGILASNFIWAQRALRVVRRRNDAFMVWFALQSIWMRALGVLLTIAVVLATLWLLGGRVRLQEH